MIFEKKNHDGETLTIADLAYRNGEVVRTASAGSKPLSNHLLFGVRIDSYTPPA